MFLISRKLSVVFVGCLPEIYYAFMYSRKGHDICLAAREH